MNDQLSLQRQQMDLLNSQNIPTLGITFGLVNENDFRNWRVTMMAPIDSPYKGGLFYLTVSFPELYPNVPPVICFKTPIYHINVNPFVPRNPGAEPLGFIPIRSLGFWNNNSSIKEVFLSIYSLFYYGNIDFAYEIGKTREYQNNRSLFEEKARIFSEKYANPVTVNDNVDTSQNWNFNLDMY